MANTTLTPNTGHLAADRGVARLTGLGATLGLIGLAGSLALAGSQVIIPNTGALTAAGVASRMDRAIRPGSSAVAAPYTSATPPALLTTSYVTPTGATIPVAGGGDLQAAINAANPGDVIVLTAGATFTGNFTLPNKGGASYVYIISSLLVNLPEGTRVSPAVASSMPKIVSPNTTAAIAADAGAHHYRFAGIEIATTHAVTTSTHSTLIWLEKPTGNLVVGDCPTDIVFDRCYIHGTATGNVRRGILMNSVRTAVVECYLENFHEIGADSQAVCAWNGPGPFKLVNNYFEGAGENIMFGGADSASAALIPSDIEFRNNLCYKPLTWRVADPSYAGLHWSVKNLFELKSAQRVLVDGNTFDRCWGDAQDGYGLVLTVRNQDGNAPWSIIQDVTITNNVITHVGGGMNILAIDNNFASGTQQRLVVRNNVFDISGASWGGTGRWVFISEGGIDYAFDHNTAFHDGHPILFSTGNGALPITTTSTRLYVINNIFAYGPFGIFGDLGQGSDNAAIAAYAPTAVVRRNAVVAGVATNFPADNFFPAALGDVGFLNLANFPDVRLAPSSPFAGGALDFKDLGVDYSVATSNQGLVLVGVAPTLRITQLATPATGVLTAAGNVPPIQSGSSPISLTPSTGALTLTGGIGSVPPGVSIQPLPGFLTLTLGTVRTPGAGALALTGLQPGRQASAGLTPNTGALTGTGNLVQRVVSGGAVIQPGTGSAFFGVFTGITGTSGPLTLTGGTLSLLVNTIRITPTGSLAITGGNAAIKGNIISPATGSLALTGIGAGISKALTPSAGTLTLTGVAPSKAVDIATSPPTAALALTGFSGQIVGNILTPTAGALTATGVAPNVSRSITPPTGALVLTSQFAELPGHTQMQPPSGALTLAGIAPTFQLEGNLTVVPPSGALTLAGAAGSKLTPVAITVLHGQFFVAGLAPSLSSLSVVTPAAGTIAAVGAAPVPLPSFAPRPATGSLALGGVAPLNSVDTLRIPSAGAVTLDGQIAVIAGPLIAPDTGTLVAAAGGPVTLQIDSGIQVLEPLTGALVFEGGPGIGGPTGKGRIFVSPSRNLIFISEART